MDTQPGPDEKHRHLHASDLFHDNTTKAEGDVDEALLFIRAHEVTEVVSRESVSALLRKVDWRILPLMFLVYTVGFIDKVALNYAAVMGLNKDLKLRGNEFSDASTWFFFAYLMAEVPTTYMINKVPVAKWLGINIVLWGVACACTAAAHDYRSLLAARIFLGIFEAPIAPCLMLISSQWYTKSEQGPRFAFWYSGLGIGQIVGGLLSFGFQHVKSHDFSGWKMMFVVLGCLTVIIGIATILVLPDTPMTARFLSDAEKTAALQHVSSNQTGVANTHFRLHHIWEALMDLQLWMLTFMTILPSISSGVVTTYSATLIKNFGYSPPRAALLNTPSGVVSLCSTLIVGYGVQYTSNRWAWYIACCIPGIMGGALMSFLPKHNHGGLLAGVYLVNFVVPTVMITYQWTAANVAGHTKRAFATSLIAGSFGVGNIIGPQTFQAKDAPNYIPAKITVLATQGAAAVLAIVLLGYYMWSNSRRDRRAAPMNGTDEMEDREKWRNLTDKENSSFRYVY